MSQCNTELRKVCRPRRANVAFLGPIIMSLLFSAASAGAATNIFGAFDRKWSESAAVSTSGELQWFIDDDAAIDEHVVSFANAAVVYARIVTDGSSPVDSGNSRVITALRDNSVSTTDNPTWTEVSPGIWEASITLNAGLNDAYAYIEVELRDPGNTRIFVAGSFIDVGTPVGTANTRTWYRDMARTLLSDPELMARGATYPMEIEGQGNWNADQPVRLRVEWAYYDRTRQRVPNNLNMTQVGVSEVFFYDVTVPTTGAGTREWITMKVEGKATGGAKDRVKGYDNAFIVDKVWIGDSGASWNTAGNWLASGVPGALDMVAVPSSNYYGTAPELDLSTTISELIIKTGGTLYGSTNGTYTLTVSSNATIYGSVEFSADDESMLVSGDTYVPGTLDIGTGTFDADGEYDATAGNTIFTGAGRLRMSSTVVSLGTLTPGPGTVEYDDQTVDRSVIAATYNHLEIDGGTRNHSAQGDITVGGNLIVSSGTFTAPSNMLTSSSNFINNATFAHNNGTVVFNGNTTISGSSTTTLNDVMITGTVTAPTTNLYVTGDLTNNGAFAHNNGTVVFNGNTTISGTNTTTLNDVMVTGTLTAPTGDLYVVGDFINDGTFAHNSGTVVFDGNTTISGTSTSTLNNATISGTWNVRVFGYSANDMMTATSAVIGTGTVNVALQGGFEPAVYTDWTIIAGGPGNDYSTLTNRLFFEGSPDPRYSVWVSGNDLILNFTPPPAVNNSGGASNVWAHTATLNGNLTSTGGVPTTVTVYWGPSNGLTNSSSWSNSIDMGILSEGLFATNIAGLTPGGTYYYRCYATNRAGSAWALSTASFSTPTAPIISYGGAPYSISEDGTNRIVTVTISKASGEIITVQYATSSGTAAAASDYTNVSGTITWLALDMADKTFTVPIVDDGSVEPDETINVSLSNAANATVSGSNTTITIIDNDGSAKLFFSSDPYAGDESATSVTMTVVLNVSAGATVTVDYATSDGTANAALDYTNSGGTLTWGPSQSGARTFTVPIMEDALDEFDETIALTLTNAVNATISGNNPTVATINDNDPLPGVSFAGVPYTVDEGGTSRTVTVTLSAVSGRDLSVNYSASSGTAMAGNDFTNVTGTLIWTNGETGAKAFDVPIIEDVLDEDDETILLTLSSPTNVSITGTNPATITITDNDNQPTVYFTGAPYTVSEDGTNAIVTVVIGAESGRDLSVDYITSNGTAVAGSDYTSLTGTLTWTAGETASKTFAVPIINDVMGEPDETINLRLTNEVNVTISVTNAAITITANDPIVLGTGSGAWQITSTSATLRGEVIETGGIDPTVRVFVGPVNGGTNAAAWANTNDMGQLAIGTFSTNVTGLSPNILYYYTIYGTNATGEAWAAASTNFRTLEAAPAIDNAGGASKITATAARLNGNLTSTGGVPTMVYIYWGTVDRSTNAAAWANTNIPGVVGEGIFSADITGLSTNQIYYYRCYASNSAGDTWAPSTTNFTTVDTLIGTYGQKWSESANVSSVGFLQWFLDDDSGVDEHVIAFTNGATVYIRVVTDNSFDVFSLNSRVITALRDNSVSTTDNPTWTEVSPGIWEASITLGGGLNDAYAYIEVELRDPGGARKFVAGSFLDVGTPVGTANTRTWYRNTARTLLSDPELMARGATYPLEIEGPGTWNADQPVPLRISWSYYDRTRQRVPNNLDMTQVGASEVFYYDVTVPTTGAGTREWVTMLVEGRAAGGARDRVRGYDNAFMVDKVWIGDSGASWNTAGNWLASGVPGALDMVAVPSSNYYGTAPELDLSTTISELIIKTGGTLYGSTNGIYTLTVTSNAFLHGTVDFSTDDESILVTGDTYVPGTVNLGAGIFDADGTFDATGGNIFFSGAGRLRLGSPVVSLGTLTPGAGTVEYDDQTANQDVIASAYNHLEIDAGTRTHTALGDISVGGNLIVSSGTFTAPGNTLTCSSNFVNNGAFEHNNGTVIFNGNTTISGTSTAAFNEVTVSGTWNVRLFGYDTNDLINAVGAVNGTGTVNVVLQGGFLPFGVVTNWTLVEGGATSDYSVLTGNLTINGTNDSRYTLSVAGNDLILTYTTPPPVVDNDGGASNITAVSATLYGDMVSTGEVPATVRIYWGTTDGVTSISAWSNSINIGVVNEGIFSTNISGLTANQTYYYRCYATNLGGDAWAPSTTNFLTAAPTVQFAVTNSNGTEAGSPTSLELTLSAISATDVTVDYAVTGGTATSGGVDYTLTNGTATIYAGSTTGNVGITVIDDSLDEFDETIIVAISNPSNAVPDVITNHFYTILDNDNPPAISFALSPYSVDEGGTNRIVTVVLAAESGKDITVDYATSNGTAAAALDYSATNGTLQWMAGQTNSRTFLVAIIEDGTSESDETIDVALSSPSNATISGSNPTTITIVDNDGVPRLFFSGSPYSLVENAANVTLSVVLNKTSAQTVTVDYATSDDTALAGSDYTNTTGSLTWTPGESGAKTFAVPIINDAIDEFEEILDVTLSNPSNAVISGANPTTVTIVDDDAPPTVSFTNLPYVVGEAGGSQTVAVVIGGASGKDVGIDYATSDGTATGGSDYNATAGTLIWSAGETGIKTFAITILQDALDEANETINVTLSGPSNSTISGSNPATVTITDEDPLPKVLFTVQSGGDSETSTPVVVQLNISEVSGRDLTVDYVVSGGSATGGADYTLTNGTATITEGSTTANFSIGITDDSLDEFSETIVIALTNFVNAAPGSNTTYTYTITDNDPEPTLSFSSAPYTCSEGGTQQIVSVSISAESGKNVLVDYATSDGAAVAGADYTATNGTLTWTAGETGSMIFAVLILDDGVHESNETLSVTLSLPGNAVISGTNPEVITITNDDAGIPIVSNSDGATAITTNSATLRGEVIDTGGENPTVRFYWGTNDAGASAVGWMYTNDMGQLGVGVFSTNVTGLISNTLYYYITYATNSAGEVWASSTESFMPNEAPVSLLVNGGMETVGTTVDDAENWVRTDTALMRRRNRNPRTGSFAMEYKKDAIGEFLYGSQSNFYRVSWDGRYESGSTHAGGGVRPGFVLSGSAYTRIRRAGRDAAQFTYHWRNIDTGAIWMSDSLSHNSITYQEITIINSNAVPASHVNNRFRAALVRDTGLTGNADDCHGDDLSINAYLPRLFLQSDPATNFVFPDTVLDFSSDGNLGARNIGSDGTILYGTYITNALDLTNVAWGNTAWFEFDDPSDAFSVVSGEALVATNGDGWHYATVRFTPPRAGTYTGTVRVATSDPNDHYTGGGTIQGTIVYEEYTVVGYCPTKVRYWVATGTGNWNDPANWSDVSGGPGGFSVPGATDRAILDGGGGTNNGNAILNTAVDVRRLTLASGYLGTVSQGVSTVTLGIEGGTFSGGTFSGGSASVDINGSLSISGGTFIATTGDVTLSSDLTFSSGAFTHNSGRFILDGVTVIDGAAALNLNDVTVSGTLTAPTGNLGVAGNFVNNGTFTDNGGTMLFNGVSTIGGSNAVSLNDVTISGVLTAPTGTLSVIGNWDGSAGAFYHNSGTVNFNGTNAQVVTTGGSWNGGTNNWKNNWNEINVSNPSSNGVTFADGFKTEKFTCITRNATLYFRYQEEVTNVYEVAASGGLTLTGVADQEIKLRQYGGSSSNQWELFPSATDGVWNVSFVDVADSVNSASNAVYPTSSIDSGGNDNWFTPTLVVFGWLEAVARDSSVTVRWKTESELNNAGFNVYRGSNATGTFAKINLEFIPALGHSAIGREYKYVDNYVTNLITNYYKLESVEFDGSSEFYGPVSAVPGVDSDGDGMTDEWETFYGLNVSSNDAGLNPDGDAATNLQEFLNDTNPNIDEGSNAGGWGGGPSTPPPGDSDIYKLGIIEDGIYRLTYDYLAPTVTNLTNWVAANTRVYNQGVQIPVLVHDEGSASFGTNDYIEFFGRAINTRFSGNNIYWLYNATNSGSTIAETNTSGGAGVSNYWYRHRDERNEEYWPEIPDESPDDDHWFALDWLFAVGTTPDTVLFDVVLSDVASIQTSATMRVALRGLTEDHHATFKLNGVPMTNDAVWTGLAEQVYTTGVSQTNLLSGTNTISITLPADTGAPFEDVLVNWIEMEYLHELNASNDVLIFEPGLAGLKSYTVRGFASGTVDIFRCVSETNVTLLTNVTVQGSGPYDVTFADTSITTAVYACVGASTRKTPSSLVIDDASTLRHTTNGADYIIIAYDTFVGSIQPLADFRASQGYRVKVVGATDVYDDFSHGIFTPYAIRDFLSYARQYWVKPAPTFVLLVGDGTYDYRDHEAWGANNLVPTKLLHASGSGETASDNWFVSLDGTNGIVPDMYIGRFPAQTTNEVTVMVNKTLAYEAADPEAAWARHVVLVADDGDDRFENMCDSVASFLPSGYTSNKIYLADYATAALCKTDVTNELNAGALITHYAGHGSVGKWAQENILLTSDINSLTNGARAPFVITPTCYNGYFIFPNAWAFESMAEELLRRDGGGAIACLSPSELSAPPHQQQLMEELFNAIFNDGTFRLGPAIARAKKEVFSALGVDARSIIETTVFFGDPAVELKKASVFSGDTSPPAVVQTVPMDGGTNVSAAPLIAVTFSEDMDDISTRAAFGISPDVTGSLNWQSNTLVFNPDTVLERYQPYTVTISSNATDLAGNRLTNDYQFIFTPTLAWIAGAVAYTGAQDGAIHIALSKNDPAADTNAVDETTVTAPGAYALYNATAGVYWVWAYVDSNGNGLRDVREAFGEYVANPVVLTSNNVGNINITITDLDQDGDGLPDYVETGTDLYLSPTDTGTSYDSADSDADGLTDYDEIYIYFTDPNVGDTDSDGLSDGDEVIFHGTDPNDPDSDMDGIPDGWEIAQLLDPNDSTDAVLDSDWDGLANWEEFYYSTDPWSSDSDGDSLEDLWELFWYISNPTKSDTDNDGMTDDEEVIAGTDLADGNDVFDLDASTDDISDQISISCQSYTDRYYLLQRTTNLMDSANWQDVEQRAGTGSRMAFTNASGNAVGYYRIKVRMIE